MHFAPVFAQARDRLGEGPFWDEAAGQLLWVDIVGRSAQRFTPATGDHEVWTFDELVSAVVPCADGRLLLALQRRLAKFDPARGTCTTFAAPEADEPANRSNEARTDPTGRFWLGTMRNNLGPSGEELPISEAGGALHRVEPDGTHATVVHGVGIANTLLWDEERRRLYFADSLAGVISVYDWDPASGAIANRRPFAETAGHGVPDGSALDAEGCVWNCRWDGGCILRYRPDGTLDRVIETPVRRPTSCVFGGPERRTLYVTSSGEGLAGEFEGALLVAEAPIQGQACTRFAG